MFNFVFDNFSHGLGHKRDTHHQCVNDEDEVHDVTIHVHYDVYAQFGLALACGVGLLVQGKRSSIFVSMGVFQHLFPYSDFSHVMRKVKERLTPCLPFFINTSTNV